MGKYRGTVIHRIQDDEGVVEVVDDQGVRSLHFGTHSRQSSMCLADPLRLELSYVRAMTSFLLFKPSFRKVLIIGLGGGSLAKFLLNFFPRCRITAVELRQSVVDIAHDFFGLPEDARLKIIIGDGGAYITETARQQAGLYDLIFADAFDGHGMAPSVNGYTFTDACAKLLTEDGILVMNLWGTDPDSYEQSVESLGLTFDDQAMQLSVNGRGNVIGFGFMEGVESTTMRRLKARAHELQALYGVEYPAFLRDLRRHNTHLVRRFFD